MVCICSIKQNIHGQYATQHDADGQTRAIASYLEVYETRLGCPPTAVYFSWVALREDRHTFFVTFRNGMGVLDEEVWYSA
jgi:hypothetical protein